MNYENIISKISFEENEIIHKRAEKDHVDDSVIKDDKKDDSPVKDGDSSKTPSKSDDSSTGSTKTPTKTDDSTGGNTKTPSKTDNSSTGSTKTPSKTDNSSTGSTKTPSKTDDSSGGSNKTPAKSDDSTGSKTNKTPSSSSGSSGSNGSSSSSSSSSKAPPTGSGSTTNNTPASTSGNGDIVATPSNNENTSKSGKSGKKGNTAAEDNNKNPSKIDDNTKPGSLDGPLLIDTGRSIGSGNESGSKHIIPFVCGAAAIVLGILSIVFFIIKRRKRKQFEEELNLEYINYRPDEFNIKPILNQDENHRNVHGNIPEINIDGTYQDYITPYIPQEGSINQNQNAIENTQDISQVDLSRRSYNGDNIASINSAVHSYQNYVNNVSPTFANGLSVNTQVDLGSPGQSYRDPSMLSPVSAHASMDGSQVSPGQSYRDPSLLSPVSAHASMDGSQVSPGKSYRDPSLLSPVSAHASMDGSQVDGCSIQEGAVPLQIVPIDGPVPEGILPIQVVPVDRSVPESSIPVVGSYLMPYPHQYIYPQSVDSQFNTQGVTSLAVPTSVMSGYPQQGYIQPMMVDPYMNTTVLADPAFVNTSLPDDSNYYYNVQPVSADVDNTDKKDRIIKKGSLVSPNYNYPVKDSKKTKDGKIVLPPVDLSPLLLPEYGSSSESGIVNAIPVEPIPSMLQTKEPISDDSTNEKTKETSTSN